MNISAEEKHFLCAIEKEDEVTIRNSMFLNNRIREKYKNTYKGFKLLMDTMQKNLLKSTSILIDEEFPIDAINRNTPLHIAVKLNLFHLVLILIRKGAEINIPDEKEDYPIHIATNLGYYDIAELLLKKGARIDVRDGNNETSLMRAIKLCNIELIKLFVAYDADMNDTWPNTDETLFYYLTITNPIPNYIPPCEKMNMEIVANIVANYIKLPNSKIANIHIKNKDILKFLIVNDLYDLLLRFGLNQMDLPFLKYTAIIHNRLDILNKLMQYDNIHNDKMGVYSLFGAAFEISNKDAYDILEKYGYLIHDNIFIFDYLPFRMHKTNISSSIRLDNDELISDDNDIINVPKELQCFHDDINFLLKICFKRRFLCLDDTCTWNSLFRLKPPLKIYAYIFIYMKPEYISDMWKILECFLLIMNCYQRTFYFRNSQLLSLFFSELLRFDYLNQLPNKNLLASVFSEDYLKIEFEHVKNCVEKLKSIIIYRNKTAFDFYLNKNIFKNVEILKEILQILNDKFDNCEIPKFIYIPLIERLKRTIKREILLKDCCLVLSQSLNWPIVIQNKILSFFTRKELKLLLKKETKINI